MPFKSQAQRRKFAQLLVEGKISNQTFEEWNRETGGRKLPERVKRKKPAARKKRKKPAARKERQRLNKGYPRKDIRGKDHGNRAGARAGTRKTFASARACCQTSANAGTAARSRCGGWRGPTSGR